MTGSEWSTTFVKRKIIFKLPSQNFFDLLLSIPQDPLRLGSPLTLRSSKHHPNPNKGLNRDSGVTSNSSSNYYAAANGNGNYSDRYHDEVDYERRVRRRRARLVAAAEDAFQQVKRLNDQRSKSEWGFNVVK